MSQASKAPIQHRSHFGFTGGTSILESLFDIPMAVLFRVKFWSISWQEFNLNFRMIGKIGLDFFTDMNTRSIPNQNDLRWNMSLEMLESFNDLLALNRSIKVPFVDSARQGQRHSRG